MKYDFIIMSKFAAEISISSGYDIEILLDFGTIHMSRITRYYLRIGYNEITDGMKVALDKVHRIIYTYNQ